MSDSEKKYTVENVGGVNHFELVLKPGVSIMMGKNGAGKTSTIRAIRRASGEPIEIERRDGAEKGRVRGPGGVVVRVGKVARTTGTCEVAIADVAPLSALIDPGLKDDEAAAKARLRSLIEILAVGADDATVATLCAPDPDLRDWLAKELADLATDDLMLAIKRVKSEAERRARAAEHRAEHHAAEASVASESVQSLRETLGGEPAPGPSVDEARAAFSAAGAEYGRLVSACEQREALEAQQAEIRATLGERPDPAAARGRIDALSLELDAAEHEIGVLAGEIEALREKMAAARERKVGLARERKVGLDAEADAEHRAEHWDAQKAILDETPEGPTRAELDAAKARVVDAAEAALETAKLVAEYHEHHAEQLRAQEEACAQEREGERLRSFAKTLPERLGAILAAAGGEGITVVDGRLCALEGGETLDWARRLSDGQRVYRALDLARLRWPGQVVALDGDTWRRLDPEHQQIVHAACVERGIFLVTEEPTDGELRCEHVGAS